MTSLTTLEQIIKTDEPEIYADSLAYTVEALVVTARLALDNETAGSELCDRAVHVVEETLSVAQALMRVVSASIEKAQLNQRRRDAA